MSNRVKHPRRQGNEPTLLPKSLLRGCIGKMRHESQRQAMRAIELKCKPDVQLYPYRCRHCKGWHLTRQAPRMPGPGQVRPNADGFEYEEGV